MKTVGEPIEAFEVFYQKDLRALMVVWFGRGNCFVAF